MKTRKPTRTFSEVKVDRHRLLKSLEAVSPGLSKKDAVEQSSCFVLVNKAVWTYNDEIACKAPSGLPESFEGAVQAGPLLANLREVPDDMLTVEVTKSHLTFNGERHYFKVRMDAEVTLPVHTVERPGKDDWSPLHDEFTTAVKVVQECAGKDESQFAFTCVHLHPKWIEACDNLQLTRYRLKTGVKQAVIVKRDSIKHLTALDMTEFAETDGWIHFRNPGRVQLSCRRHVEEFPDLTDYLKVKGEPTVLPKGISKDAKFAEIFSKEVEDRNLALVTIKDGKIIVKGIGVSGDNGVRKKVKYSGRPLAFGIAPKLLQEITKRHVECQISREHLRVDGDHWVFVTCLESPKQAQQKAEVAAEAQGLEDANSGDADGSGED